ncbi:MAG TPA: response regulator [Symbiobacteriaceae bacterium]|jgi:CheY-like chemotaxis protein
MGEVILVADDEPLNQGLACKVLRANGFTCVVAADGEQALAEARAHRPALILMDLAMPRMDGWTATRLLRADAELVGIPVLAVTAHAMVGDRERALAAGCDAYLAKPYRPAELMAQVNALLRAT